MNGAPLSQSGLLREDIFPGHVGKTGKTMISSVTRFFAHTFHQNIFLVTK